MSRVKSFDAPHKALRNILSKTSLMLGKTIWTDSAQVLEAEKLIKDLFSLLENHAHSEDFGVLKILEDKNPGATEVERKEHREIEDNISKLKNMFSALLSSPDESKGFGFYLEFTNFHAFYLSHIYKEETITEKRLWECFSDEELIQHRIKIMSTMEFETLLLWFKYGFPAFNESERYGMLLGFKRNSSAEKFNRALEIIGSELGKSEIEILIKRINATG